MTAAELALSVTWDQGTEKNKRLDFTVATGVNVHFCDPHAPAGLPELVGILERLRAQMSCSTR